MDDVCKWIEYSTNNCYISEYTTECGHYVEYNRSDMFDWTYCPYCKKPVDIVRDDIE